MKTIDGNNEHFSAIVGKWKDNNMHVAQLDNLLYNFITKSEWW